MNKLLTYFLSTFAVFAFAVLPAYSQEKENKNQAVEEQELTVNADSMEMLMDNHTIELDGNVIIEDQTMRLTAKKMTVHLDKDNKVRDIEAFGGVTVRKLDSSESATGDSGLYDAKSDVVTLSGNCIILQGKNTITGDKVAYDRKLGTIKLKGASITIPLKKGKDGSGLGNILESNKKNEGEKEKNTDGQKEKKPEPTKNK